MFKNRQQAGQLLGERLKKELGSSKEPGVVLAVPRGGVVTADQVARILNWPLDVIITKKINPPNRPELAIGAVGETKGSEYLDQSIVKSLGLDEQYLEKEIKAKKEEIARREKLFRQDRPARQLKGKTVVIVDDGAATGATMIAAAREVWNNQPEGVIIGLPVLAKDTLAKLEKEADRVIFLKAPKVFFAVGQFYQKFNQTSDREVVRLLSKAS